MTASAGPPELRAALAVDGADAFGTPVAPACELILIVDADLAGPWRWMVEAQVRRALRAGDRHICLDLSELHRCDSALLSMLARCQRIVRNAGGRLSLYSPSATVRRALLGAGLDSHLRSNPTGSTAADW